MFSNIFLSKENLISNVNTLKEVAGKNLCVMVKANAYGHGAKEIVSMLDEYIDYFGVSNQTEAEKLREITNKNIIVFGACEDYQKCLDDDISFALLSYEHTKDMIKISKKIDKKPRMHLCINSGMNRYGVRDIKEYKKILALLIKNNIELEGIYTHFSSLTSDKEYTQRQKTIFEEFCKLLPTSWNTIKHIGGGITIFSDIDADMYRVGIEVYGYNNSLLKPVMKVESKIVDIQKVLKGEHIGYLCGFTAKRDMKVATIPLGYGDGLPRKLSNKMYVTIKGSKAKSVGNICMDAFMVDVTNIKCSKGDKVIIMENATELAPMIESTEYEVLTNFAKFRGERIIK